MKKTRRPTLIPWLIAAIACTMNVCIADNAKTNTLKIVNWNVLYGFNHHKSIEAGSHWIHAQNPDILALQELNGISEKDLLEQAKKWGHTYAATHKKNGFPLGLTSNEPIEVLERKSEGFHHGYLHCKTYGIHFFVVHFWPGKAHELDKILNKISPLLKQQENVIILGDFNGCSQKDEAYLIANAIQRKRNYTLVDMVETAGFVDIVHKHDPKANVSCPSSITIPKWSKDMEELARKRYRIDFVFADGVLAKSSHSGTISLAKEIESISDHYPVIVTFDLSKNSQTNTSGNGTR